MPAGQSGPTKCYESAPDNDHYRKLSVGVVQDYGRFATCVARNSIVSLPYRCAVTCLVIRDAAAVLARLAWRSLMNNQDALDRFRQTVADAFVQLEIDLEIRPANEALIARSGRPRATFPRERVVALRKQGCSWRQIARTLGVGVTTIRRAYSSSAESG